MTSFSNVQYTSSGTPRAFPQVKKQVHLGKDARSSDVLYFACFGEETWNCMHFSENFVSWCQTLIRTALHRFYVYRNTYFVSRDSKMCTFEVLLFCVWCLDNWSRILSGKPFNTFSMARLKTLHFHLTLTPLFTATHTLFFLSFTIFVHDLWLWYLVYSRVTLHLWLILIHRDLWNSQKWQKPLTPFKVFVFWKGVLNRSKFTNIFFLQFSSVF